MCIIRQLTLFKVPLKISQCIFYFMMGETLNYPSKGRNIVKPSPKHPWYHPCKTERSALHCVIFWTCLANLIGSTNSIYVPLDRDVKSTYSYEETRQIFPCEVCSIHLKGKVQLDEHLKSKRHKRMLKHMKKKSESRAKI